MEDCSHLIIRGKQITLENLNKIADIIEPYIKNGTKVRDIMNACKIGNGTIKKVIEMRNLKSRDRKTPLEIINQAISIYKKTEDIEYTSLKTGLNRDVIYRYLKKLNIQTKIKHIPKSFLNAKKEKKLHNNRYVVEVECQCCKKYYWSEKSHITKSKRMNKPHICDECNRNSDVISGRPITKKNTSGYIGVYVYRKNDNIYGYKSVIVYKKCILMKNLYKDETLNDKTLIQSAIDRDIFIIEHNLPHRRNFTDKELFVNMEYLAYDNINTLKEKLESKF